VHQHRSLMSILIRVFVFSLRLRASARCPNPRVAGQIAVENRSHSSKSPDPHLRERVAPYPRSSTEHHNRDEDVPPARLAIDAVFINQSSHRGPLAPGAAVLQHSCRGGCSSRKINVFIFRDVYPHRHSPMSILIRCSRFSLRLRVSARCPSVPAVLRAAPPRDAPIPACGPGQNVVSTLQKTDGDTDPDGQVRCSKVVAKRHKPAFYEAIHISAADS